jgi:Siphovirus Gp157
MSSPENAVAPAKIKVSLAAALTAIAEIESLAEEGLNESEAIDRVLALANSQLADSVDRRVCLVSALTGGGISRDTTGGLIGVAISHAQAWTAKRKHLEAILERIKETTAQLMIESGRDKLSGTQGEFRLQANAPALEIDIPTMNIARSNVITVTEDVDIKYVTMEHICTLNKERVKDDLKAGVDVPWARLIYNKHLRMKQNV